MKKLSLEDLDKLMIRDLKRAYNEGIRNSYDVVYGYSKNVNDKNTREVLRIIKKLLLK